MSLHISITHHKRNVDAQFDLESHESLAIVGPNASGKSTVLLGIAGLLKPDAGRITIDETTVFARGEGMTPINIPVHKRGISMLVQRPLLFPHMTVRANVEFGPRSIGLGRAEARKRAMFWLERADIAHLAERSSTDLSGGQSQRVALARALAVEPRLLLLDEPMAALDAQAVPAMRTLLAQVARERPTILVTHDLLDAVSLSTRAIVIENGRVSDEGPTERVLLAPRTSFGARLGGLNVLHGTVGSDEYILLDDGHKVTGRARGDLAVGEKAIAVFSPSAVLLVDESAVTSAQNKFTVEIDGIDQRDGRCRISAGGLLIDVTLATFVERGLAPGQKIHLHVKAMEVELHPV
ncbi:MAG: ABC transporter ATP-binding protein [Aeromicrobium sp.]|nr:MAG: ABC transporter ATP-binding protein [Aeromicrobium sp.]